MTIDFHTHTTASDGQLTPIQLLNQAKKKNFTYIAKTDHDNVDLMDVFLRIGQKLKIHTIPGIEISSRYKNKSAHIVGLGIDHKNKKLIQYCEKCRIARKQRGQKMATSLEKIGFKIKKSEMNKRVITRPHIAFAVINHKSNQPRIIKEFGRIPTFSEFINKYLAKGCSCFTKKTFSISANSAIKLIHQANGLAILAHPKSKTTEFSYSNKHLIELLKLDFDGIEIYSTDHTKTEIDYLKNLAQKKNLLISAGSDYHGIDKKYQLGKCNAGKFVTEKNCQDLINKLNS